MKALRSRPIVPWPRRLLAAAFALAVLSAVLVAVRRPAAVPPSSSTASAPSPSAPLAASPSSGPTLAAVECPLPTVASPPTQYPTALPSLGKSGAAPRGWPVSLANMEATGRLADDGTSYFIQGDHLVAVDGTGHERTGWPEALGLQTDLNTQIAFGSDGTVYVWDMSTLVAYRADGTRSAGWPYHAAAVEDVLPAPQGVYIEDVLPVSQGVYVESELCGPAGGGDESRAMTLIGTAGAVQSTWRLLGEIAAIGRMGHSTRVRGTPSSPTAATGRSSQDGPQRAGAT